MFDENFDTMALYENFEDDCEDCENDDDDDDNHQIFGYDYEYENPETENIHEMYENCFIPSVYDTAKFLLPLFLASLLFNLITHIIIASKIIFLLLFSSQLSSSG